MSETIVGLVTVLLGSGVLGVWHTMRKDRKEAPVKQRDADIAAAHTSQQMALAVAEALRMDLTRTQGDVEDVRAEAEAARKEAAVARADAAAARHENGVLWVWIRDIRHRWALVRVSETPPPEPTIH
ncbi:hypothetical protein [Kocuria rhizophila]|uniref:hypothetical protein n=1 Tax=Kocuria rhizophila TaxID=72000 RepID=UPI003D6E14F1